MKKLVRSMVRYRMIEKHLRFVREGKYDVAHYMLRLLNGHVCTVEVDDIPGILFELEAERCGCRISYSKDYKTAYISI